ncbi:AraC family transcriptional regulator [Hamadaea tsunoensis]|uniref:AraC family transcriptional regulator n=1 Tax=Hamadaea tsunoensis TaxID=53368 RepID=UPI00040F0103|nr:helix-turn-helix transcriptional regulator [Hamadaea tsunoensis]
MSVLPLAGPPVVSAVGVGLHGVTSDRDTYLLPQHWQLHLYSYEGTLTAGGTAYAIRPGHVSLVPPGTRVDFVYRGRSEHLFCHFQPGVCDAATAPETASLPVMQDAGPVAATLSAAFHAAIGAFGRRPAQVAAEIWAALWRVATLPAVPPERAETHPAVAVAIAYVQARLGQPLTVAGIARHAGVSQTHLLRLFRAATGETVVAYVRRRRLEQAGHLLRQSTLSIPAIAATVGIPDLQAFNKACRRELGGSPRAVRARAVLA